MSALVAAALTPRAIKVEARVLAAASVVLVLVACSLVARGINPMMVLALSAVPLLLAVGYRWGLALLTVIVVLRPLIDSMNALTGPLALAAIALGAVCALNDLRALVLLGGIGAPVLAATVLGYDRFGSVAINEALKLISVTAVAAVVLVAPGTVSRVRSARVVQLAALAPSIAVVFQTATGTGTKIDGVSRSSGLLAQANPAAFFFCIGAIASALLAVEGSHRALDGLAVVWFALAVVSTGSITGLLTFIVALVVYVSGVRGPLSRATGLLLLGLAVTGFAALMSPIGQGRLAEFNAPPGPEDPDNSVLWRFKAWGKFLGLWHVHPLTGNGLGATQPGVLIDTKIPHNEYIWLLVEVGLVGLVLALGLGVTYVCLMYRFRRGGASRRGTALALSLALATALNALTDNTVHFTPSMFVLVLLLATAWRCASDERAAAEAQRASAQSSPSAGRRVSGPPLVPADALAVPAAHVRLAAGDGRHP